MKMRAVIVGDSIVKYIEQGKDDVNVYCKPGSYIEDMAVILNENGLLDKNICDLFLFHVGTNNLSIAGASVLSCVDKMKKLCHLVQDHCPNAKLGISGVLTRKPSLFRGSAQVDIAGINKKIEDYNVQIEKFCSLHGVFFVDNSSFSHDHLSKDGLHLNFSGSHKLSQKLYSFIDKLHNDYLDCGIGVGLLTDEYPPLSSDCTNVNKVESPVPFSRSGDKLNGWQQKYVKVQTVGESNNFAEKLHLYQQNCDKISVKTMNYGQRKPLIKNRKNHSFDQGLQNYVSEEQKPFSSVTGTGSYLKTSNRFQVLLDETVDENDRAIVFDDFDANMHNSEFIRGEGTQNRKKKRSHQLKKRKTVKSCKKQQKNHLRNTCINDAVAQKQTSPSFSDSLKSTIYQVSVDISVVSSQPSHIVFSSCREDIPMSCIYSFVHQKTGVSVRSMFFREVSGQYIDKHSCLSCTQIENIVMFFKMKGGGRGRKRKGEDCHPNKACGPCIICGKVSFRYFHLSDRENDPDLIKHFRTLVPTILDSDCICKGCDSAYRNRKNVKPISGLKQDTILMCHLSTYGLCHSEKERAVIVNEGELVRIFNLPVDSSQDINMSVMLCKDHRLKLFNMKNKCSVCTKQFLSSHRKYNLPDTCADFVALYMSHIPGNEIGNEELKPSDLVFCGGCFYAIQKFMADNYKSEGGARSYDNQIYSVKQIWSTASCIANSPGMAHCIVSCCNAFMIHKPVLLANIYNEFLKHASIDECQNSNERWLLQKILQVFGDSVYFITDEYKKMGTMLKRADNNDNKALHDYLYNESLNRETSSSDSTSKLSKNRILISAAELLREKLHDQKQILNKDSLDLEKFDPCRFIQESCDPVLFHFISILQGTKPYTSNFGEKVEFDKLNRTKALSCLNIVCCILFSSDLSCRIPLQMLLSDIIDKYTNSSTECLRILNQFGICYSKYSLKDYQTSVIQRKKDIGVQLSPISFTICSVDNINKRSSYAYVKSSDLNRGFDGTSVQLVEPLPETVKWDKNELATPSQDFHTLKDKQGIYYKKIVTASDLSLFRSVATLCFSDMRKGERDSNGMLENADNSEKETAVCNSVYSYVNKIVQLFLETNETLQNKDVPVEYYQYLAISYLVSIPVNVFHIVESNQIEIFFQTNYQEVGKHMSSHVLNILKETDEEGIHFYPIFTSHSVFNENLVSEEFHTGLNNFDVDKDLLAFSFFVQSALPSVKVNSSLSHEFVTQFSNLNLSFSSGRNLSCNENLTSIPNDPYCFNDDPAEEMASLTIDRKSFAYCVKKYIAETNLNSVALPTFLQDLEFESVPEKERSNIEFVYVMEENADNRETIKLTLNKLYNDLGVHKNINYLVVVGDGKTYDHLVQLKNEFKDDLDWLLPYIGDWHVMKNYQLVLMKIYLDAGLKELVELFHQGVLAKVVSQATGFDKTHNFLIQSWEALFRFELEVFFLSHDRSSLEQWNFDFDTVCHWILDYSKLVSEDNFDFQKVHEMVTGFQGIVDVVSQEFYTFFDQLCSKNRTWKFWHNFIHVDSQKLSSTLPLIHYLLHILSYFMYAFFLGKLLFVRTSKFCLLSMDK